MARNLKPGDRVVHSSGLQFVIQYAAFVVFGEAGEDHVFAASELSRAPKVKRPPAIPRTRVNFGVGDVVAFSTDGGTLEGILSHRTGSRGGTQWVINGADDITYQLAPRHLALVTSARPKKPRKAPIVAPSSDIQDSAL
jgi:hypothetical protein